MREIKKLSLQVNLDREVKYLSELEEGLIELVNRVGIARSQVHIAKENIKETEEGIRELKRLLNEDKIEIKVDKVEVDIPELIDELLTAISWTEGVSVEGSDLVPSTIEEAKAILASEARRYLTDYCANMLRDFTLNYTLDSDNRRRSR